MLTRFVRQCFGWEVWSTIERDDPERADRAWDPWRVFQDGYLVGQWTGPRRDLLCVVRCSTVDEATRCLAVPAPTVRLATLASLLLRAQSVRRLRPPRARADVVATVLPILKRRYAREIAMVAERLGLSPLE
jgi:hypothetical protein